MEGRQKSTPFFQAETEENRDKLSFGKLKCVSKAYAKFTPCNAVGCLLML
jgi:hypothetical protein